MLCVAYNKAIQVATASSFPGNVTAKTAHSLAGVHPERWAGANATIRAVLAWLSHLSGQHVPPVDWAVAAVVVALAVLVLVGSVGAVVLWPRSRLWAIHSRLHRLATKNDGDLRRDARYDLDDALRMLRSARQACVRSGQVDDAAELALLMHGIEMARDQVACDYVPSPVRTAMSY